MLDVIEKLLTLQDRDQRLRSYQTEITLLPEERKAREKQIAESAAKLEQAKTRAKEIEIEKRNLEMEARAKRDSIVRYKQQQLQTRRNEEYSALAHEIEAAEKTITALEDRELDLMEELEKLTPQIASAEKAHAEERARIEHLLAGLETKRPTWKPGSPSSRPNTTGSRSSSTRMSSISTSTCSKPNTAPPSPPSNMRSAWAAI